jgi:hypothetical protein
MRVELNRNLIENYENEGILKIVFIEYIDIDMNCFYI